MNEIVLLVILPLLGAFLLPILARASDFLAKITGPLILVFSLGLSISAWNALGTNSIAITLGGFLPPTGIVFYIDQLALLFSILIALVFLCVWPWNRPAEIREYSLYLLLAAASFGLVLSGDLFNLYVFYELLAVASYGLIARQQHIASTAVSLRYLFISSAGSVMLLLGIAIIYTQTGSLNIAHLSILAPEKLHNMAGLSAFILIAVGAGVKAEMFPVNSWVAEVYGVVEKPLAVLMAGLISKLAVILIVRILLMLFQQPEALQFLLVVGILGVISGELVAWRAKDMVRMLSFSSIAQLGLVFIALAIPGEMGLWVALALMLHHLLVKGGLFFLAEKFNGSFTRLTGFAAHSPFAVVIFIIFVLSLLGIPPLPGFWVKLLLILNLAAQDSSIYYYAITFVLVATVIEASYLFRLIRLMYQPNDVSFSTRANENHLYYSFAKIFAVLLLTIMLYISPIEKSLHTIARVASDSKTYINTVFPGYYNSHNSKYNMGKKEIKELDIKKLEINKQKMLSQLDSTAGERR
jgi:formate hydrogenlyase subunit 3/multisubunit Na+/H+ antiporter MnhD subunit